MSKSSTNNGLIQFFRKRRMPKFYLLATVMFFTIYGFTHYQSGGLPPGDKNNAGLVLPDGFQALSVIDSVKGTSRHLAVNTNGDIYVKVKLHALNDGYGNVAIRVNSKGKAETVTPFGKYPSTRHSTAMRIHNGYLYFSSNLIVYRQKLVPGQLVPDTKMDTIVHDTGPDHTHQTKPLAFDGKGYMYVGWGAGTDICTEGQPKGMGEGRPDAEIPGEECPWRIDHAGIWKFSESKLNQTQDQGKRVANGMRSIVGMDWEKSSNALYAVVHGRDSYRRAWPDLYSAWESAMLPSEELFKIHDGIDGGWPYYYYDHIKGKKLLNPEYGGDKVKEGNGAKLTKPVVGFPGHFAPDDILFYKGNQFPARYKKGAFVAFHGSTIRAPYPQAGYFVAFVPMENGVATGPWEVFADGFIQTDPVISANSAGYRPVGLAEGPDGSLYISESEKGKIWRVMFKGDKAKFGPAQLAKMVERKKTASNIKDPDPVKDDLMKGKTLAASPVYTTYCAPCHQTDGRGDGLRFPTLVESEWVTGDKKRLINVVLAGLSGPIKVRGMDYSETMPPHGFLTDEQVSEALTYIRRSWNNNSTPVSKEDVAEVRRTIKN